LCRKFFSTPAGYKPPREKPAKEDKQDVEMSSCSHLPGANGAGDTPEDPATSDVHSDPPKGIASHWKKLIEEVKTPERAQKKRRIAVSDDEVDEEIAPIPSPKVKSPKSPRKQSPKSVTPVEKKAVSEGEESDSVSADDEPDTKTKKKVAQKL
jgi:hypothetical protein